MYKATDLITGKYGLADDIDDVETILKSFFAKHLDEVIGENEDRAYTVGDVIEDVITTRKIGGNSDHLETFLGVRVEVV